ncbi:Uncharacterised protein [Mycobacteroides abscessus subsp. abscessus]|nr:Uncharacterised protein [Mycobacteroides abscessus subsp. abscessus]
MVTDPSPLFCVGPRQLGVYLPEYRWGAVLGLISSVVFDQFGG